MAFIEFLSNNINTNSTVLPTGSTSNDATTFSENMNSQQTLELISSLLQNKKHVLKRIMNEENNDISPKRSKNNQDEEITSPFFDINLSGSLSSTPAQIQSNNTIGKL